MRGSLVSNCAVHHGKGYGMYVINSGNLTFINNTFFDFYKFGILIETSGYITLDGNYLIGVRSRNWPSKPSNAGDKMGGILVCATTPKAKCDEIYLLNNVVAGVDTDGGDCGGYVVPTDTCDTKKARFMNNVAHSNNMFGAIVFMGTQDSKAAQCSEVGNFYGYKNNEPALVTYFSTKKLMIKNMVFIDNRIGLSANSAEIGGTSGDDMQIHLYNLTFHGEVDTKDCSDKFAMHLPLMSLEGKKPQEEQYWNMPHYKFMSDASFGTAVYTDLLTFKNFTRPNNWCGR